ncbi:hypothetical protein GCM10027578_37510 [Spirosoma luteolum]
MKKAISTLLTQVTKPKMKNKAPIMSSGPKYELVLVDGAVGVMNAFGIAVGNGRIF